MTIIFLFVNILPRMYNVFFLFFTLKLKINDEYKSFKTFLKVQIRFFDKAKVRYSLVIVLYCRPDRNLKLNK